MVSDSATPSQYLTEARIARDPSALHRLGENEQHLVVFHQRIGRTVLPERGLVEVGDTREIGVLRLDAALSALPALGARRLEEPDADTRVARLVHHADNLLGRPAARRGGELRVEFRAPVVDERLHLVVTHLGIVLIAREDGVFVGVVEHLGDLRGHAHCGVAIAQAHQQSQVERIVELAPLREVALVKQVARRAGQRHRIVVERIGSFQIGEQRPVDLLLRVENGLLDILRRTFEGLRTGHVAEQVGDVLQKERTQRQGDRLVIGVLLADGQLAHVVGVGRLLVEVAPRRGANRVFNHIAMVGVVARPGDGVLDQLAVELPRTVEEHLGPRVEQFLNHARRRDLPQVHLIGIGVVFVEVGRAGARPGEQEGCDKDMFQLFHGWVCFRIRVSG